MLKWILFIMSLVLSQVIYADVKTIRFATEATYPPFEYVDAAGNMQGFDIDIANALCKQMHAQCTFANQAFNSLIPSLTLGKFDAIIGSLSVTPERLAQVNFTRSYYEPSAAFVAPLDKHFSKDSISGKKIGAQAGSTYEKYLQDKYGDKVTIKPYASVQDALLDLVSGRIDMVLADLPIEQTWLQQGDNGQHYGLVASVIKDPQYVGTGYGIAVRKEDKALLDALNHALVVIKKDGEYGKIRGKYFGK